MVRSRVWGGRAARGWRGVGFHRGGVGFNPNTSPHSLLGITSELVMIFVLLLLPSPQGTLTPFGCA